MKKKRTQNGFDSASFLTYYIKNKNVLIAGTKILEQEVINSRHGNKVSSITQENLTHL